VVEQALLVLRVAFVVLLYVFIWWVVRSAVRDVRAPQESLVLTPAQARAAGLGSAAPAPAPAPPVAAGTPRLRVVDGPVWPAASLVVLDEDVVFGRAPDCDAVLDGDTTASGHHARVFHRDGSLYVEDLGSTNGTFVNAQRLVAERRLRTGDIVAIGATSLVFEGGGGAP